jgi:plasmid segregation protein ParM
MAYRQYIDNGNGRFKGKDNSGHAAKMLSVVGTGFMRKHSFPSSSPEEGFLPTDQIHISVTDLNSESRFPQEYFVGLLARNESKDGERIFNTDEMTDPRVAVAMAAMSALLNPRNNVVESLAIGLPLGQYHEKRQTLKDFISGVHLLVEFRSGNIETTKHPIVFKPREVKVYPQAGAGLYACLFHKDGSPKYKRPGLYAGLDIGWGTTDFMVIEVLPSGEIKVRGDMTDTVSLGISHAIDLTRSALENKYGSINRNEFENQLLVDPKAIMFKGNSFDLSDAYEAAKKQVALSIIGSVRRKWGDKADYIVESFLFGGGAIDFGDSILKNPPTTNVSIPDQPDITNLNGYEVMDMLEQ